MNKHYDKYTNISQLYSELGSKGSIFKKSKKSSKSGGKNTLALDRVIILKYVIVKPSYIPFCILVIRRVIDNIFCFYVNVICYSNITLTQWTLCDI